LAEKGYDPMMGARPLARKIDEMIKVPLSRRILFDRLHDCEICVDAEANLLRIDVASSKVEADPELPTVDADGYITLTRFKPRSQS